MGPLSRDMALNIQRMTGLSCQLFGSGRMALAAALRNLKMEPGQGVAIPAYSCPDVAVAVRMAGLEPVPVDCTEAGLTDVAAVTTLARDGVVSATVAVHLFGLVDEGVAALTELLPVVEDTSHVPPGRHVPGSAAVAGSLEATKLIGAGEGGYLLADEIEDARELGARISDLSAYIGSRQLERLDENLSRRESIAKRYAATISPWQAGHPGRKAWFRFVVHAKDSHTVDKIIEAGAKRGISLRRPIATLPVDPPLETEYPNSHSLLARLVSIPLLPDLKDEEIYRVVIFLDELGEFL